MLSRCADFFNKQANLLRPQQKKKAKRKTFFMVSALDSMAKFSTHDFCPFRWVEFFNSAKNMKQHNSRSIEFWVVTFWSFCYRPFFGESKYMCYLSLIRYNKSIKISNGKIDNTVRIHYMKMWCSRAYYLEGCK